MKTNIKKIATATAGLALVASMALASSASAAESNGNSKAQGGATQGQGRGMMGFNKGNGTENGINKAGMMPAVVGKVTAINGNSISVLGRQNIARTPGTAKPTTTTPPAEVTYTINATNAVVVKNKATSTVSSIAVGDMLMVQGTVSGTNVTATNIRDNVIGTRVGGNNGDNSKPRTGTSTPAFVGNGQPIVAGKIVTVSGNTLTVTTATNITYTVDATNAKVLKGSGTIALSNVVAGDSVVVQGAISGSSVTASTILDKTNVAPVAPVSTNSGTPENKDNGGFFGGISKFFMNMFGF